MNIKFDKIMGCIREDDVLIGGLVFQGLWDASTNTPTLADGTGTAGDFYMVSVAGSQDLGSGSISFDVDDYVLYNSGGTWEKHPHSDKVDSVFTRTGNVVATVGDYDFPKISGNVADTQMPTGGNWALTSALVLNSAFADADVTINKNTSGVAYNYDAGTDVHAFDGALFAIVASASKVTMDNAIVDFNASHNDVDFTISKNTAGEAFTYDAGTDTISIDAVNVALFGGSAVTSVSGGVGDNDKLVTQGYVDDSVGAVALWSRVTGPPNYVLPATSADDIGATGARITKGWFTDLEVTNAIAGSVTGNAGTVSTITGLAPDTATTQATQPNITSIANLVTVGTIGTGVWQGTAIADLYIASASTWSAKQDALTNGVEALTSAEVSQLANIGTSTVSVTQWGILGGLTADASEINLLDGIASLSTGVGDNDKIVTQGYVDDAVSAEDIWDRVTGTPNYVIPKTVADDIGATGARITKGWFTDMDIANGLPATVLSSGNIAIARMPVSGTWAMTDDLIMTNILDDATGNQSALQINYTVNKATSGGDYGLNIEKVDTASPGTSLMIRCYRAGVMFTVNDDGLMFAKSGTFQTHIVSPLFRASNTAGELTTVLYGGSSIGAYATGANFTSVELGNSNQSGVISNTSGVFVGVSIENTYNQASGTAGNTDLFIDRTETAVGSGEQLLISAGVGGTSVFKLFNDGVVHMGTPATNYAEFGADGSLVFVGTAGMAFAGIYVKDSVATISVDSDNADTIITQWTTDAESNNCTADSANDKITFTKVGKYLVTFSASVSLDAGATVTLRLDGYLNAVIVPQLHASRTVSSSDVGSMSFSSIIDVTTVSHDLDIRANINSATGRSLTVEDGQLNVVQIAGT